MKNSLLDKALYDVAAQTLEKLALMFLIPQEEADADEIVSGKTARVNFRGPFSGCVTVTVCPRLLPQLAANMLGLDEDSRASGDQQKDALKELANVLCGNLLPALAGSEPVFHVGAPTVEDAIPAVGQEAPESQSGFAQLFADAGLIELRVFIDKPLPLTAAAPTAAF